MPPREAPLRAHPERFSMSNFLMRPCGAAFLSLSLAACAAPVNAEITAAPPVLGVDLGGAPGPAPAAGKAATAGHAGRHHARGGIVMTHSGHAQVQAGGTVNSVHAAARTVNISHGPIPALGWPAMTMDFTAGPEIDLQALKPGTRINFTVEHGEGDRYIIRSLTPAGGR